MTELRCARPEETSRLKVLWKLAFGDEDACIDFFFAQNYHPEDMLVLLEDGVVMTMLYLMPLTLRGPSFTASSHYVYALATHPDARQRGYGRQLLLFADQELGRRGDDCITVVPAQPSLHKFFATVGFSECFASRLDEIPDAMMPDAAPGADVCLVSPSDYNALRRALLDGGWYVDYPDELIAFQAGLSRMSGAGLYRLALEGETGCAAVEYTDEDTVVIKELLMSDRLLPQAVAQLARRLRARHYHARTPAFWTSLAGSYIQPFGMIKWYSPAKETNWPRDSLAYMGLGFD